MGNHEHKRGDNRVGGNHKKDKCNREWYINIRKG
jgi:hypothetical protein